ncbi:hypothetical protein [Pedobacter sp.]|uniref:hypothetical protein n=1 Tax=Pedobacter sp. TaxID=1411316 RepID=UPI00396CC35E
MEVVILKTDGTPVRLDDKFTQIKFDSEGFLVGFTYSSKIYKFFQNDDFEYRGKDVDLSGYYKEIVIHQYIANMYNTPMTPIEIKAIEKFPFAGLEAQKDDPITVKVVDFSEPYNYYYKENTYTFNIELDGNAVKKYKKRVYDNHTLVGFEIDLPSSSFPPTPNNVNLMEKPTGYFFRKNFGEFVENWSVTDGGKRTYKKITTLSAYKINYIVEDVIEYIIPVSSRARIYGNANSGTNADPDPNGLSPLENLVFTLLWNWGYFYNPTDDPQYIYKTVLNPIMSGQPDFYEYSRYYNGLCQFYFTTYRERDKLKELNDDKKMKYLLSILPVSALRTIPYEFIEKTLLDFITKGSVSEEEEQFIVRLVISIDSSKANIFLDFLLEKNDKTTYFEILYRLLDDARLERYTIVNWFVDEQPNRKYYAYALYELWKKSKYNWNYFPPDQTPPPPGSDIINLASYFITTPNERTTKNVFEFGTAQISNYAFGTTEIRRVNKYHSQLDGKYISIIREDAVTMKFSYGVRYDIDFLEIGRIHLYHPMTLSGYQPNLDLNIPQRTAIPIFLFYFAEEYDELADFDAGISLAINLSIDLTLFFASGGLAVLNDIKYLKYITQLGRAIRGELTASEAVVVWRAADVGGDIVTFTAGAISNYLEYLSTTENDPAKKAHHQKIQMLILGLMLFTGSATAYARYKAVKEAEEILEMISHFPGTTHGVPPDLVNLVNSLASKQAQLTSQLGQKLQELKLGGLDIDNVITVYGSLSSKQKYIFYQHYGGVTNDIILLRLNRDTGSGMNNWLRLINNNIMVEAKNIDFVTKSRNVDTIINLYDEVPIRRILEAYDDNSRLKVIQEFVKRGLYNDTVFIEKVSTKPEVLDILKSVLNRVKYGHPDELDVENFIDIASSTLVPELVKILANKSKTLLKKANKIYDQEVASELIGIERLRALQTGTALEYGGIFDNLTGEALTDFMDANKLLVKGKVYNGDTLINSLEEVYISGGPNKISNMFSGSLPSLVREPNNVSRFKIFKTKAFDLIGVSRSYDTELKMIFNLMEDYWHQGDQIELIIESTLEICTSCRGYFAYLKMLAKSEGKTLNIKVISHPSATSIPDLNLLLN